MEKVNNLELFNFYIKQNKVDNFFSEDLISKMELFFFKKGEYICKASESIDYLFFLVKGKCSVFNVVENGKSLLICFYNKFEVLCEFEFFNDGISKTNIKAVEDTYCFGILVWKDRDELMKNVKLLKFLCAHLCKKLERSDRNNSINLLYSLENRLASYILLTQKKGCFFSNYTQLAEYLGTSHRHLLRVLHGLCDKGILMKKEDGYHIKNIDLLVEISGDCYQ